MKKKMICPEYKTCTSHECGKHFRIHKKNSDCKSRCGHIKNSNGDEPLPCISATKLIRKKKIQKINESII